MPVERTGQALEDDAALRELLQGVQRIAVLGIKAGPRDDAFQVPRYMQAVGYRILPVNPKHERVLGEPCVPRLADLPLAADLIDVFRAPAHIPAHVDEILALARRPRAVWLQEGIRHDEACERLRAAGIDVVQDLCLMVEHARLLWASA